MTFYPNLYSKFSNSVLPKATNNLGTRIHVSECTSVLGFLADCKENADKKIEVAANFHQIEEMIYVHWKQTELDIYSATWSFSLKINSEKQIYYILTSISLFKVWAVPAYIEESS